MVLMSILGEHAQLLQAACIFCAAYACFAPAVHDLRAMSEQLLIWVALPCSGIMFWPK